MKDENETPREDLRTEKEQPGTPARPSVSFLELGLLALAIILGVLYLYTDLIPLSVLLPVFSVIFTVIPVMRLIRNKKEGLTGFGSLLSVIGWLIMAVAVLVATVYYFVR